MKNQINLVELLKDCPKGMKLGSTLFNGLEFDHIDEHAQTYPIVCRILNQFGMYDTYVFTKYGCYNSQIYSKCVIFPKGKTTWEGINIPFKDGDIVSTDDGMFTAIVGKVISLVVEDLYDHNEEYDTYCHIYYEEDDDKSYLIADATPLRFYRLATEEEKERLFQAIKDNGYEWNPETKTLKELIKPRFKVGDKIKHKSEDAIGRIEKIVDNVYYVDYSFDDGVVYVGLKSQDDYELVPNKFDITTLKPFDKVLVRDNDEQLWSADFFGFHGKTLYPFNGVGHYANKCVPYEGNEHLLGTTDDCDEFYKTWE